MRSVKIYGDKIVLDNRPDTEYYNDIKMISDLHGLKPGVRRRRKML